MSQLLSISEVASLAGVRPSALRYYEDAGLITPAARVGGRRHYHPGVVGRLGLIALCKDTGFTIAEIRAFLDGHAGSGDDWREAGQAKVAELDGRITRAKEMRRLLLEAMSCTCTGPDDCVMLAARRQ